MGTLSGNILALVIIVASSLVGFVSLEASTLTFVFLAYLLYAVAFLLNFSTKPVKDNPFCQHLSNHELEVYKKYHLFLWFPGAAEALSALLNALRVSGFIWGGLCLWNGLYWLAGLSITYFFVTGGLILKLNPRLYLSAGAQKGDQFSLDQILLIERVQEKREMYNIE